MKLCQKDNPHRKWIMIAILVALLIYECAEDEVQVAFVRDLLLLMGGILTLLAY